MSNQTDRRPLKIKLLIVSLFLCFVSALFLVTWPAFFGGMIVLFMVLSWYIYFMLPNFENK